jgi:DNA-binding CsgD family transcriptional regulator
MPNDFSVERASHLTGLIYDCAIEPARWEEALHAIRTELDFFNAMIGLNQLPSLALRISANASEDSNLLDLLPRYAAKSAEAWGGRGRIDRMPLDEPVPASHATERATWRGNPWYDEWMAPQGFIDAVVVPIARDPTMIGVFALTRHASKGEIGELELAALRLLAPHVRRAVTISNLLDNKTLEAATFASTLDVLAAGVVLVDEETRPIYANAAAQTMLDSADAIRLDHDRLQLSSAVATAALADAVTRAASDEQCLGQRGIGIPARRKDGNPAVVHVLPLKRGELRPGIERRAAAAIFVAPAAILPRMPADALALIYDLTPAETRVLELMVAGKSPAEIAETVGILPNTVKTHLQHVFNKTGAHRQADLVRLVASLSLPV